MEQIIPRLRSGNFILTADEVKFVRESDGRETVFPKESHDYLLSFVQGKNIQTIILDSYRAGKQVNFSILKDTLLSLYWSKNLINAKDFGDAIEHSDWLPVNESHLSKSLLEIDLKQNNFLFQLMVMAVPVALVILTYKLFSQPIPQDLALLLFPSAFLSLKGVLSGVWSALFNVNPQILTLQISYLGIYLGESTFRRSKTSTFEYFCHLGMTVLLGVCSYCYFMKSENPLFNSFGPLLVVLLMALCSSPAHKTDLSNFFRVSGRFNLLFSMAVFEFFTFSIGFFFLALIHVIAAIKDWQPFYLIPVLLVVISAVGFFLDFLDDLDFVFDQLANRIISRVKPVKVDLMAIIKNAPIFQTLPENILKGMGANATIHNLGSGMTVFKEGQKSTELYYIVKGRVGIYKSRPDKTKFQVLQLSKESIFGEGGFFLGNPRSGDAITLEKTKLVRIKRPKEVQSSALIPKAAGNNFQKKIWAFQAISHSKVFNGVPSELLMQIVNGGQLIELPANQILMKQGDLTDSMWLVIEGSCRATADGAEVRSFKDGDVFGEIGIVWNTRRTGTIVTTSPSILLRIEAAFVYQVLSLNLNLGVALQGLGAKRLVI